MNQNPKAKMKPEPTPDPAPDPSLDPSPRRTAAELDVDVATSGGAWVERCADPEALCRRAAKAAFDMALVDGIGLSGDHAEVSVLLSDDERVHGLNRDYRGIDRPTNVLSFSGNDDEALDHHPDDAPVLLGDIVVAFETVSSEARRDGKTLDAHLAHMIVHGMLHLMGYDHETDDDANEMEAMEIRVLAHLGVADPYAWPRSGPDRTTDAKGRG